MIKGQKEATLLALKMEEADCEPRNTGETLEVEKGKETNAPLEPPETNLVLPMP